MNGIDSKTGDMAERKRMDEVLRESERRYRALMNLAGDAIVIADMDGNVREVNRKAEKLFGYSAEEFLRLNIRQIHPEEVSKRVIAGFKDIVERGAATVSDLPILTKEGKTVATDLTGTIIEYEGTKVAQGIFRDITERKRHEELLRQSEELHRLLFHGSPAGIFHYDTRLHVTNCNQRLADILKSTRERLLRLDMNELVDQRIVRALTDALKGKEGMYMGYYRATTGEAEVYAFLHTAPLFDENREVKGGIGIVEDLTARKAAEDSLRESEELFRAVFDRAGIGIALTDLEGRFIRTNASFEKILGYTAQELKEITFMEVTHPADLAPEVVAFDRALLVKAPDSCYQVEKRHICRDGRVICCNLIATLIRDGDGRPRYGLGMIEDITEKKNAETALRESEERYRSIFENAVEGMFQSTPEGRYIRVNPASARMFGFSSPEEMLATIADIAREQYFDPGERETLKEVLEEQGGVENVEQRMFRKDGTTIWVSTSARVVRDENGKPIYYEGTHEDVTWRKEFERQLIESEERYRTAIENSNDGVAIVKDGHHLYVNKRFIEIFGYGTPEEIIGEPISIIVSPEDRERIQRIHVMRLKGEYAPSHYEFKGVRRNGQSLYVEASATQTTYLGHPVSLVYLRDITERRNLEAQLRQVQKMEAIGQMAGGIAHDFNNILTTLIGYGNLLLMKMARDDPLKVYVDQMLASSQKAAQLTQSLLAFGRKQMIELKPQKVNTIIKGLEKLLVRLLTEDIELRIIPSDVDPTVMADVTQIDQVLMNLATNARDAMPRGGLLTIEIKALENGSSFNNILEFDKPGNYALISVSDTGHGMDEQTREKIFEPFFTTKEVGKGTGLGLSIVYGIVKQHDGYIHVESTPGEGTTFYIFLPIVRMRVEKPTLRSVPAQGGRETILLVEDHAEVRRLAKNLLEEYGYTVLEAEDGVEAVHRFSEGKDRIDLAILDVVMPRKNGKEAYDEMKKSKKDLKALFISGYTADMMLDKGIYESSFELISKPMSPNELLRKVREVLDK
jgi:two-component system, cell cycle sensor histidine kinase and response regulator CckA